MLTAPLLLPRIIYCVYYPWLLPSAMFSLGALLFFLHRCWPSTPFVLCAAAAVSISCDNCVVDRLLHADRDPFVVLQCLLRDPPWSLDAGRRFRWYYRQVYTSGKPEIRYVRGRQWSTIFLAGRLLYTYMIYALFYPFRRVRGLLSSPAWFYMLSRYVCGNA